MHTVLAAGGAAGETTAAVVRHVLLRSSAVDVYTSFSLTMLGVIGYRAVFFLSFSHLRRLDPFRSRPRTHFVKRDEGKALLLRDGQLRIVGADGKVRFVELQALGTMGANGAGSVVGVPIDTVDEKSGNVVLDNGGGFGIPRRLRLPQGSKHCPSS
jgi:hypothetical protein